MSKYERYDRVAADYDQSRIALGADVIADCLAAGSKPLDQISLLDAGCGTGNYSAALVGQVGRIAALDLSSEMLAVARTKLANAERAGKIAFHQSSILELPFPDAEFDAVMFNQVLHHLEPSDDPLYGGHGAALAEAHRVLRPGGMVVVNICTHEQLRQGYWYYDLIPAAREAVIKRCISAERLEANLEELGFALQNRIAPLEGVMQGPAYFNPRGPLDPDWRRGDSIWALASAEEVAQAEARIATLDRDGALDAYLAELDAKRPFCGQFSFFAAVKT